MHWSRRHSSWRSAFWLGAVLALGSGAAIGKPQGFDLDRLPKGKDVTIPRPATTFIPLAARVQLTATDMPQTLSLKPVHMEGGAPVKLKLAIYDRNSERVQYIEVRPGTSFLYAFKNLGSITVIPGLPGGSGSRAGQLKLQVESDKPLTIAH